MTAILRVEFPWGKYHATEWGRNVNEGQPEWPPSPWRILRALFATWKNRCAHLRDEDVEAALSQLSGPPTLHLPAMRPAHLRHYMPQKSYRSVGKPDTTLTFDPFAVIDPQVPAYIEWDAELAEGPTAALSEIAAALSYLGRSESICRAEFVSRVEHPAPELWKPAGPQDHVNTEVLCPQQPFKLSDLLQSPDTVRRNGRIIPPGSHLVPYTRVDLTQGAPSATDWRPTYAAVRLAVHPRPRPTIANAVAVGELLRRAALKKHGEPSETLSGKQPSGDRNRGRHEHAHYLSLAPDQRLEAGTPIDSLVVWASGRLNGDELAALAQVKWLRAGRAASGVPDIAVAVTAFGDIEEVAPEIVGPSHIWRSLTPFVPGRHPQKLSWEDHIQIEIARELSVYRDFPTPTSVTVLDGDTRRYRRRRLPPKETIGGSRRAAFVEIRFKHLVKGPIIIGSMSHFGLGLFTPARRPSTGRTARTPPRAG